MIKNYFKKILKFLYYIFKILRLKNKDFTIIASNCIGGLLYNDLRMRYLTPFVGLYLEASDFIKLLYNFDYYMTLPIAPPPKQKNANYPIVLLGDLKFHFVHYETLDIAIQKWEIRKKRINRQNCYILFTERDGCTYNDLKAFDNLPFKNKVVFTHKQYKNIKTSFYIKGDETKSCSENLDRINFVKRKFEQFDIIAFLNNRLKYYNK